MYIVIEGIDNAGKTTVMEKLHNKIDFIHLKEPGELKETIDFVKCMSFEPKGETLALLFAADRLMLKSFIIKYGHELIISDRSMYSSFVYQEDVDLDFNVEINKYMVSPDLVIYLDIPVEIAVKRGLDYTDIFEQKEYLEKIRESYQTILARFLEWKDIEFITVDATQSSEEVFNEVFNIIRRVVNET